MQISNKFTVYVLSHDSEALVQLLFIPTLLQVASMLIGPFSSLQIASRFLLIVNFTILSLFVSIYHASIVLDALLASNFRFVDSILLTNGANSAASYTPYTPYTPYKILRLYIFLTTALLCLFFFKKRKIQHTEHLSQHRSPHIYQSSQKEKSINLFLLSRVQFRL